MSHYWRDDRLLARPGLVQPLQEGESVEDRARSVIGFCFWLTPRGGTEAMSFEEICDVIREFQKDER